MPVGTEIFGTYVPKISVPTGTFYMMKSILYKLKEEDTWKEYLNYKLEKANLSKKEQLELIEYINSKKYIEVVENVLLEKNLSIPEKKCINKLGNNKKRVVYSFKYDEVKLLKVIAFLLYCYDEKQSNGCFSFRKGFGAHKAIKVLTKTEEISKMWSYKLDIHDYFNSIPIPKLLPILKEVIKDDMLLYEFFENFLTEDKAYYCENIMNEKRGVMAGTPTSPFLANIYLKEIDEYFIKEKIPYARYSDDIIFFTKTEEELIKYRDIMLNFLNKYELTINTEKEKINKPEEEWEFLGVSFKNGEIDLSEATKNKLKGKISRKARAIRRWMLRKNATNTQAMKVMIKIFNRKFYTNNNINELTWAKWFFPLITKDEGLREIDNYLQKYIRYIPYGKHSKKNYKVKYKDLKELGYKSLVNEYYLFAKSVK